MTLYLAADKPLPLVAWDADNPGFNVSDLNEEVYSVRHQFSKRYLYCLGSHQGCGCGFSYGQYEPGDEEDLEARESVRRLAEYLSEAVRSAGPLELYSCWSGDESMPSEFRRDIMADEIPDAMGGEEFSFEEREFIVITERRVETTGDA